MSLGHSLKPSPWPASPCMSSPGCPPPHRLPCSPLLFCSSPAGLLHVPEGPKQAPATLLSLLPETLVGDSRPACFLRSGPPIGNGALVRQPRVPSPALGTVPLLEYTCMRAASPAPRMGHGRCSFTSLLPKLLTSLFRLVIGHIFFTHLNIFHIFCGTHVLLLVTRNNR